MESIEKKKLLTMIKSARTQWEGLLTEIPEAWMSEPSVAGEWSVKDIIAHITWGESEALGVMQAHALVGSELWRLSEDERNAAVIEQSRGRHLYAMLEESRQIFQQYLEALESLSEDDLNDPHRFPGMPEGWLPWRILYDPTHYDHHMRSIRVWLGSRNQAKA